MSNTIPLLPCPWCGSDDVGIQELEDPNYEAVGCNREECGAFGPVFYQDQIAAVAAWNRGPYVDRIEIHAAALDACAAQLQKQASERAAKAKELRERARKAREGSEG